MNSSFPAITKTIPSNPHLKITFAGPSILCLSGEDKNNRAEIGYLDLPTHETQLIMVERKAGTKDKILIKKGPMQGNLEIKTQNGGVGEVYENGLTDKESLEHIIDLTEFYPDAQFKSSGLGDKFQSKIYIDDSVFSSVINSDSNVRPRNEATGVKLGTRDIREVYKASTKSKLKSIIYSDLPEDFVIDPDAEYEIVIDTNCDEVTESDFKNFYHLIDTNYQQHNLTYSGRPLFWLADIQIDSLVELRKRVAKVITAVDLVDDKNQDQISKETILEDKIIQEILVDYYFLSSPLCGGEPCVGITFINESRNLP